MSAGTAAARRLSKWKVSPRLASLLIALGVFLCMLGLRRGGWLQILEFHFYDDRVGYS
jgi:CHASE2 domain-containing sensor protein